MKLMHQIEVGGGAAVVVLFRGNKSLSKVNGEKLQKKITRKKIGISNYSAVLLYITVMHV